MGSNYQEHMCETCRLSGHIQVCWTWLYTVKLEVNFGSSDRIKALDTNSVQAPMCFCIFPGISETKAYWFLSWIGFPRVSWYSWQIICCASSQVSPQGYKPAVQSTCLSIWTPIHPSPLALRAVPMTGMKWSGGVTSKVESITAFHSQLPLLPCVIIFDPQDSHVMGLLHRWRNWSSDHQTNNLQSLCITSCSQQWVWRTHLKIIQLFGDHSAVTLLHFETLWDLSNLKWLSFISTCWMILRVIILG